MTIKQVMCGSIYDFLRQIFHNEGWIVPSFDKIFFKRKIFLVILKLCRFLQMALPSQLNFYFNKQTLKKVFKLLSFVGRIIPSSFFACHPIYSKFSKSNKKTRASTFVREMAKINAGILLSYFRILISIHSRTSSSFASRTNTVVNGIRRPQSIKAVSLSLTCSFFFFSTRIVNRNFFILYRRSRTYAFHGKFLPHASTTF